MLKTFAAKALIVPALATALTLGSMTTPARADTDDTVRAILGIAALAAIANSVSKRNNNDNTVSNNATYGNANHGDVYGSLVGPNKAPNWSNPNAAKRRPLPEKCLRTVRTSNGLRTVYGAHCLSNNYNFADFLPRNCRVNIRVNNNRLRPAYATQCLRRDGWKVQNGHNHPRFANND